jgi:hypothetical protein
MKTLIITILSMLVIGCANGPQIFGDKSFGGIRTGPIFGNDSFAGIQVDKGGTGTADVTMGGKNFTIRALDGKLKNVILR